MGCCESDMYVRDDQFTRIPMEQQDGFVRRGPLPSAPRGIVAVDPYGNGAEYGQHSRTSSRGAAYRTASDPYDDRNDDEDTGYMARPAAQPYGNDDEDDRRSNNGSVRSLGANGGEYYNQGPVHRQGDDQYSTVIRSHNASRVNTPAAYNTPRRNSSFAGTPRTVGSRGGATSPRSSFYGDSDDELVLICADCGAEVFEFATPKKCPLTGKLHS